MKKIIPNYMSLRATHLYGFMACLTLLVVAVVMQVELGLEPCPLCVLQRIVVVVLGFIFLCGLICSSTFCKRFHASLLFLLGVSGAFFAGWQVILERHPTEGVESCSPSLSYMLQNLPLNDTIRLLFQGSGSCGNVQWEWLGLSLASWTLVFFIAVSLLAIVNFWRSYGTCTK